jgi:hypothetical protein
MRLVAAALVLASAEAVACSPSKPSGPRAPVVTTIVVPLTQHPVGLRWVSTEDYRIEAELRHGAKSAWFGSKRRRRTETEILAVDPAGVVTKVAITYHERDDRGDGPGAPPPTRSAIVGSSYVAAVTDGKLTASRADGRRLRDAELRELALDLDSLGKLEVMDQILARTWQVGVKVDPTADELRRLNEDTPASEPRPVVISFTLREVRGDEAELLMSTRMQSQEAVAMTIDASGRVLVDLRTGCSMSLSLSGAVNGNAAGVPFSGNMSACSEVALVP